VVAKIRQKQITGAEDSGNVKNYNIMADLYSQVLREVLADDKKLLMHGGSSVITSFDSSKIQGGARASLGYGVYFSDSIYKAKDYGPVITYLDPSKLNILDINESVTEEFVQSIRNLANKQDGMIEGLYNVYADKLEKQKGKELEGAIKTLQNEFRHNQEKNWAVMLIRLGYDAVKSGYEYVIFNFPKADKALVEK
jgi:hypothetical protein